MAAHEPFHYADAEELLSASENLGGKLPYQEDTSSLFQEIQVAGVRIPNRLAVQPMEGADARSDGTPSELTIRRYRRFAAGGSGLIWFEATAVLPSGRSNPHQLLLDSKSVDSFRNLVKATRQAGEAAFGREHAIFCVLQLTHSGRYSKPDGHPRPLSLGPNPHLEERFPSGHIVSDEELDRLKENFIETAQLAASAGFDAVDIKCCHGYLLNEILAGYHRERSRYGGGFENRISFLMDVIHRIRAASPQLGIAVRLSAYDGIPFPYGYGFIRDDPLDVDVTETSVLLRRLSFLGCALVNITAGNPYLAPHLGRPYDRPLPGAALPQEHPLQGVMRLLNVTSVLQRQFPQLPFVGTGYSWLRQHWAQVGAAVVAAGQSALIGLGRSAFAYPDAPKELAGKGRLNPRKVCITCSRCSALLRYGHPAGCVVRDKRIYGREYRNLGRGRENGIGSGKGS